MVVDLTRYCLWGFFISINFNFFSLNIYNTWNVRLRKLLTAMFSSFSTNKGKNWERFNMNFSAILFISTSNQFSFFPPKSCLFKSFAILQISFLFYLNCWKNLFDKHIELFYIYWCIFHGFLWCKLNVMISYFLLLVEWFLFPFLIYSYFLSWKINFRFEIIFVGFHYGPP